MIHSRQRKILYVDDTEEQRYAMRRILEGAGYSVIEAGSGAEAFRQLAPPAPEEIVAIILDVRLPDMSGYDVCRKIKADPKTSGIPVLQISASFADPTLRAAGLSGGADAYVAQPVHPTELLALVNALIRAHDSEKTLRFQAEVSASLSSSLDHHKTVRAIESTFAPRFCDRCMVYLRPQHLTHFLPAAPGAYPRGGKNAPHLNQEPDTGAAAVQNDDLSPDLVAIAEQVAESGSTRHVDASTLVVPLAVGRKKLGALIFNLDGQERRYTPGHIPLAEDLADRAALALQNATLYTAQQSAQAALVQSEKLAAAGRLSAAIAHEINNPLEAITNLMFLIETSEETPPTIRAYAQEALSELSRLTHIARQSLGFYRELTGPTTFDLNESLEDTLNIYLKRFGAKNIRVEREYAPQLNITAVKGEIRQVISNLLVNAYDAVTENGTLRVETNRTDEDDVQFRVINTGPGIAEDVLPYIFEPFFSTKDGTGTGLGLWVSESIVRKHGGTIQVINPTPDDPDPRTTFQVTLPREAPSS
jgi:two-component system NtrC family sensor kinase